MNLEVIREKSRLIVKRKSSFSDVAAQGDFEMERREAEDTQGEIGFHNQVEFEAFG
jgi:hypothetical protein